jgi:NOL1/NOP2/fmu family ribosome biogenesis protein
VLTVPVDPSWNIMGSLVKDVAGPIYRFLPGQSKGEGLFMAALRKKGTESARTSQKTKEGKRKRTPLEDTAREWLLHSERYDILQLGEKLTAIPKTWKDFYCRVMKSLQVMHAGITIGEIRGKDLVPNQSLALSVERHPQAFPAVELTVEEAISYLRREPLPGMSDQPRGYVVVTCMGLALGFLKNLGTRTNNLYPQEWRIKSSYIDTPCLNIHRTI